MSGSQDYKSIMQHEQSNRAANLIANAWKRYKGKEVGKPAILFKSYVLAKNYHAEFAKLANAGDYLDMLCCVASSDLTWDVATRYIFKAFEDKLITDVNVFVTAKLLIDILYMPGINDIKAYNFTDKTGPYQLDSIKYQAIKRIKKEFFTGLATLPAGEQKYFALELDVSVVISYLMSSLLRLRSNPQHVLRLTALKLLHWFLTNYYPKDAAIWQKYIATLSAKAGCFTTEKKVAITRLKALIKHVAKDQDMKAGSFFEAADLEEQIPCLVTQLDKVYFIFLSLSALKLLKKAVHGDEAFPHFFTVGIVSTRFIKAGLLTDDPLRELYQNYTGRVVELVHPDINRINEVHGMEEVPAFFLSWHDLFHAWCCGSHEKSIPRHLISLYSMHGTVSMSKLIWLLTDMDFHYAAKFHETGEKIYLLHVFLAIFLEAKTSDVILNVNQLLLLFDLLLNSSAYPEFVIDALAELLVSTVEDENVLRLQVSLNRLLSFVRGLENLDCSKEQLIIGYKLKLVSGSQALLNKVRQSGGVLQFFYWGRNKGLIIRKELRNLMSLSSSYVDELTSSELFKFLPN